MRSFLFGAVLVLSVNSAAAQSGSGSESTPPLFNISLSSGILVLQTIEDGPSNSVWDFGVVRQYRVGIDRAFGYNTSLGVMAAYAPVALHYGQLRPGPIPVDDCVRSCAANADLWTFGATLRVVSGTGFHHMIELNAMMHQFSNFRDEATSTSLAPLDGDRDLLFTAGYGFGFSAGRRFHIALVGDVGFTVHTRSGRESDLNRLNQLIMGRVVIRSGIGG